MADKDKGRIAFKLSTKTSSTSSSAAPPATNLGKRRRNGAFATDHDSDSSDSDSGPVRHESITGFGAAGAETSTTTEKSGERSPSSSGRRNRDTASQPSRDWRDEHKARRQSRNPLPGEAEEGDERRRVGAVEKEPADDDKDVQWGLSVRGKKRARDEKEDDKDDDKDDDDDTKPHEASNSQNPLRTAEDAVRDAAYRRAVVSVGAPSTAKDYEAIDSEEFGASLLRSMGWDGVMRGPRPTDKRHRNDRLGLGIGAVKADVLEGEEKNKKKRPRLDAYRKEESRRKESRRGEDSYKREREREREGYRDGVRRATSHRDRHGY
ncbi:hypothetical protein CP532_0001 [Ophiocordyceps camponoti-leonardi (nom. inval.)]|nr:hypothetical protein CP532_0001 [Ophiocordyceps camponoti-leonardi (nom. inval.)]